MTYIQMIQKEKKNEGFITDMIYLSNFHKSIHMEDPKEEYTLAVTLSITQGFVVETLKIFLCSSLTPQRGAPLSSCVSSCGKQSCNMFFLPRVSAMTKHKRPMLENQFKTLS